MGKSKAKRKQLLVALWVVLFLVAMVGVGALVWWLQNKNAGGGNTSGTSPYSKAVEKPGPEAVSESQNLAIAGKTDEAAQKLQQALQQPGVNDSDKQQLYIQEGVVYSNSGQYQKALDAFLAAEKAKSDFTTSHLIGEQYEALGNNAKAIEYYKKALAQLDPNAISYGMDKEVYEAKVKELGGQL